MKNGVLNFMVLAGMTIGLFAFVETQTNPWEVPDKYKNMKNPVASDTESISIGKALYNQHCKSCHGKEGLGDGPKAAQLDTPAGDFSTPEFHAQGDGALFYKSWIGRDDMPNFEKKIPDEEDVWHVINFLRTLE
jgi:mono/diheme cytochrome c family protein